MACDGLLPRVDYVIARGFYPGLFTPAWLAPARDAKLGHGSVGGNPGELHVRSRTSHRSSLAPMAG